MSPALVALCAFVAYFLGYRLYARYLALDVFRLDDGRPTPAHTMRDDVDYVPTRPSILFGHHFASITGLAPMLGPAVAVIWGWLPAVLWVVLGAIFVGCMHDFSAMVLSVRHRGASVGEVAHDVISPRARTLFHLVIFFGVALAMGVFVYVIARLFSLELAPGHPGYPQAVLPSGLLMVVAMVAGWLLYRRGVSLLWVTVVGFAIELSSIRLGMALPTLGLPESAWPSPTTWTWILLGYAFVASVLPVWALLQSRDFLNALLLYLGLGLAYLGLLLGGHEFVAPATRLDPEGAPSILPFVFIVIACGAASGFHGLVSSGTTAKQLDKESHARPVGYGAMIGESLLGLLATLACTAGLASPALWDHTYHDWAGIQALPKTLDVFIQGTTAFLTSLGLPADASAALIAMVVVSFALTTLDSAHAPAAIQHRGDRRIPSHPPGEQVVGQPLRGLRRRLRRDRPVRLLRGRRDRPGRRGGLAPRRPRPVAAVRHHQPAAGRAHPRDGDPLSAQPRMAQLARRHSRRRHDRLHPRRDDHQPHRAARPPAPRGRLGAPPARDRRAARIGALMGTSPQTQGPIPSPTPIPSPSQSRTGRGLEPRTSVPRVTIVTFARIRGLSPSRPSVCARPEHPGRSKTRGVIWARSAAED
ncbi:carbon starvation protein A [Paraliomyxa miuraensis]|nr:carbon starvation protein A [Paraliomyxa miuraensis]MCX4239349.1 carbon starvation protein A [Paraliomyxa miuraensis]